MPLRATYFKKVFEFNFKARTSRGLMKDKTSWFIKVWDHQHPEVFGLGECGPLPGLSPDACPDFEDVLRQVIDKFQQKQPAHISDLRPLVPRGYPSIIFGFETAMLDLQHGGKRTIYKNKFTEGQPISINGLIWMGDMDFMMSQINEKIRQGFRCIKLKVGGLDFDRECDTLQYIRKRYFREDILIRLDANGAFKIDDVLFKLDQLSKFTVQSIEQPIKPGLKEMEELCRKSPIPVAFDEELIGKEANEEKIDLLDRLKPQFIILKPTLHGGLQGCAEWIDLAEQRGIGWWLTSALESSVGLNAICQFTANYPITLAQGLGTGTIYKNNFESPLKLEQGKIFYDTQNAWDLEEFKTTNG
ncbi:MAG: o-succinylbenzoate synthase [Bacteroidota bacterium]